MIEHVPPPSDVNPDSKMGDRWFNYRSMQYIAIELVNPASPQGGRVLIRGEGSGRTSSVLLVDLKNPRFFRFISGHEVVTNGKASEAAQPASPIVTVLGHILDELRAMNGKLDLLVAAWAGGSKG
jgi:hypothetical protein